MTDWPRAITRPLSSIETASGSVIPVQAKPSIDTFCNLQFAIRFADFARSRPQSVCTCSFRPSSGSAAPGRLTLAETKERAIDAHQQQRELATLVGRVDHQHAAAFIGRKPAIVQVVAVHRDERAAQLLRELVVLQVGRAPQLVLLEHEEHVPLQA